MHDLGKVLFGLIKPDTGSVRTEQGELIRSPGEAMRHKIGYISKNRDTEALMGACSIRDNICLPILSRLAKMGLIRPRTESRMTEEWGKKLKIKMRDSGQYVMQLSGGNKQKVSIAKWLASDAEIFILDCPTRGIDIGVKNDIYELLYELRNSEKAILMISEELPELIGMSDRIMILKEGTVNKEFKRNRELSERVLIEYML
jgi:ribose transport system ATP-binding protein